MKNVLLSLLIFFSIGKAYAIDYLYIENFTVHPDSSSVTIPLKAHFDNFVSGWEVHLNLPNNIHITKCKKSDEIVIYHLDPEGSLVRYDPVLQVNSSKTSFIGISFEMDYDENGNPAGVAKWIPGDYIVYYLTFSFDNGFTGGNIQNHNVISCGVDTRSWVIPSPGYTNDMVTKITVSEDSGWDSINEVNTYKQVNNIRYFNFRGEEINSPKGLTIVVVTFTDGTLQTYKIY